MKKLFNNRGYTLIELLVVLALLGILAAIAIPRIDQDYGYVDSFTDDFAYDLRYIRESTMEGKDSYEVKIYYGAGDSGKYEVCIKDEVTSEYKAIKTNSLKTGFNMIDATSTTKTNAIVKFSADGILHSDALTIEISGDGQDSKVTINSVGSIFVE